MVCIILDIWQLSDNSMDKLLSSKCEKLTLPHYIIGHTHVHTGKLLLTPALPEAGNRAYRLAIIAGAAILVPSYICQIIATHQKICYALKWRHNERDGVSNHQPHDCSLSRLFRHRSQKTAKLRVTGLCEGNSPVTGEFPAQKASYAENVSIWWRRHGVPNLQMSCSNSEWFGTIL